MFKYLGLQIQQSTNGIEIHQKNYAEKVEAVKIDNSSKKDHALLPSWNSAAKKGSQSIELGINTPHTLPDMTYAACIVSRSTKDARVRDFIVANKFIKFLKSRDVALSSPKNDNLKSSSLISFSDASFANLICSGSQGGLIIILEESNGKYIPLAWQSRKLKSCEKYFDSRDTSSGEGYRIINNDQIHVFRKFENATK